MCLINNLLKFLDTPIRKIVKSSMAIEPIYTEVPAHTLTVTVDKPGTYAYSFIYLLKSPIIISILTCRGYRVQNDESQ